MNERSRPTDAATGPTETDSANVSRAERPIVGITLGDINGIGPEVVLKVLADPRIQQFCLPVVYGSAKLVKRYRALLPGLEETPFQTINAATEAAFRRANLIQCWEEDYEITPGRPSEQSGNAAFTGLKRAVADLASGTIQALVTGPIHKANMPPAFKAKGHTDYLARVLGQGKSLMVMAGPAMRVAVATDHIALTEVPVVLNEALVREKLEMLSTSLKQDFGVASPRIAVLGVNPHAGEEGLLGSEEKAWLNELVRQQRQKNFTTLGPFAADGFFGRHLYRRFDAVLAMYHDQGLIPFKALMGDDGVNYTAGLPQVRTSPSHGTAFDIAGKNLASPDSMRAAIYMAVDVWRQRQQVG